MNGVYLKLAIYLYGLLYDNFTVLAVCVTLFHLLKQLPGFLIMIILLFFIIIINSSSTEIKRTL